MTLEYWFAICHITFGNISHYFFKIFSSGIPIRHILEHLYYATDIKYFVLFLFSLHLFLDNIISLSSRLGSFTAVLSLLMSSLKTFLISIHCFESIFSIWFFFIISISLLKLPNCSGLSTTFFARGFIKYYS